MNLRKVYDHAITVRRGGDGMMGFIQPVCSCGWIGREHYNYCNSQHSNFDDNAEEHLFVVREGER
jgi:hypothetical protein